MDNSKNEKTTQSRWKPQPSRGEGQPADGQSRPSFPVSPGLSLAGWTTDEGRCTTSSRCSQRCNWHEQMNHPVSVTEGALPHYRQPTNRQNFVCTHPISDEFRPTTRI
ncbi:hypothetical protein Hdeb2414_s0007g00255331 [Helianthus debilis subsp. tardiflorus]